MVKKKLFRKLNIEKPNAILSPTTKISRDASIENTRGNSDCIHVGAHTYIQGTLFTYAHAGEIRIGDWSYVGIRSEIRSMDSISIGDRVLISRDVNIIDSTAHSMNQEERHAHFQHMMEVGHPEHIEDLPGVRSLPIIIEDDVWVNFGATILKGVRIGKGSIIAAGSIVTHDVPPGVFYRNKIDPVITPLDYGEIH
jgi:maltose O-acetyltransferase